MENLDLLIQNRNLKLTKARRDILNALFNASKPLSYEELKEELKMDKATFYRNISIFETSNLINKFESKDKKWYFELITTEHSHFICNNCHKIECIKNIRVELKNYLIESVILRGVCVECLQKSL